MAPDESATLKKINRGLLLNFLTALSRSAKFFFYVFLGHFMGEKVFGLFILCWSTVEIGSKLIMMGLDIALFRELSIALREGRMDAFKRTFITSLKIYGSLGLGIAFLMIPGSDWVAKHIYLKPELGSALSFLSFSVVLKHLSSLFINGVMANKNMMPQFLVNGLGEPFIYIAAILVTHYFSGDSLSALAFYHAAANGILLLMAMICFVREYKPEHIRSWLNQKPDFNLLRVSLPLGLSELSSNFLQKLPLFILGRVLGAADAALFAVGHQVAYSVVTVRTALTGTIYPSIGEFGNTQELGILKQRIAHFTVWAGKMTVPILLVILHFEEQILRLLRVENPAHFHFVGNLVVPLSIFTIFAHAEFVLMMLKKGLRNLGIHLIWILLFGAIYLTKGSSLNLEQLGIVYFVQIVSVCVVYWVCLNWDLRNNERFLPFHRGILVDVLAFIGMGTVTTVWDRLIFPFEDFDLIPSLVTMGIVAVLTFLLRNKILDLMPDRYRTAV